MVDHELARAAGGDSLVFELLVERYRDPLYSFALQLGGSPTAAAELVQESFLSACVHFGEFRTEAEFDAWVHWIAASHASLRQQLHPKPEAAQAKLKSPKFGPGNTLAQHSSAEWSRNPEEQRLSPELRQAIENAIASLPQSHRQVFLFKDLAQLSYDKIASLTGESIPTIKERIHQARLRLRETIDGFRQPITHPPLVPAGRQFEWL